MDIEIAEPSLIYDRDTKNKTEELDRLHAPMKEILVTTSNTEKLQILTLILDSCHKNIVLNTSEFESILICKRTEAKKGDTCTTFPEKR